MDKTVAEFIGENSGVFKTLVKIGQVPATVVRSHQIYTFYSGLKTPSKMQRYEETAIAMRVTTRTVMTCVKDMQKTI